jgi:hypothetical protein
MNHDHQDIEAVLQTYFDGVYEDDPKKIAAVSHACFHMFSVTDGKLNDVSRDAWIGRMGPRPSAKARNLPRHDWVITIDQSGPTTAFAKVNCQLPPRYFTDYLTLVKLADGWRIMSKTYHAEVKE